MSAMTESAMVCSVAPVEAIVRIAQYVPVFPCRPGMESIEGKTGPLIRKAKSPYTIRGFRDATQDPDLIRAWWNTKPTALVGVPTGSITNFVVLDYDSYKASPEANSWIEEHTDILMATRTHTTLGGGRHYLFRAAPGARYQSGTDLLLSGAVRKGIDLRAEGGYIIWWPLHGGMKTGDPIRLPTGLIDERLMVEHPVEELPKFSPSKWQVDQPLVADALAYLDPHSRDTWRDAGMAIHLASGGSDTGFELWHAWSAGELTGELPHNYSGLNDCRYHWSTFRHDKDRAHTVTLGSLFAAARKNGYAGNQKQDKPEPAPRRAAADETPAPAIFRDETTLASIMGMDPSHRDWFFAEIIPAGAFLIVGRPKVGKSWLLMQLAVIAAHGGVFLGYEALGQFGVLYIAAEDDYARIQSRFSNFNVPAPANLRVIVRERLIELAKTNGEQMSLAEYVDGYLAAFPDVKFVFIDTESTCRHMWDGENGGSREQAITRKDYAEVREFDSIAQKRGAFIGLVNHTSKRKNGQWFDIHELINRTNTALAGASGSIVLADPPGHDPMDADSRIRVLGIRGRDIKGEHLLAVEQNERGEFTLLGPWSVFAQSDAEEHICEALIEIHESGDCGEWITARQIAQWIGKSAGAVQRAVTRMVKKGRTHHKGYRIETKRKLGIKLEKVTE